VNFSNFDLPLSYYPHCFESWLSMT